ncbi:bleomycin resistance protein [Legionella shakespearei DSM 23087]|uniref:Bleomycin resistance protein n=2 Tax=Legionella shakespearei TaxID=45075 RepID=A0A0W0YRG6_9GAMM|nr:bleomycin resistance protein [Legionella shakespearei DSM 23087]
MIEPKAIILYVDDLAVSTQFYQELFGKKPQEESPTFNSFTLSNGMSLGLKASPSVLPPVDEKTRGGELAFTVDAPHKVDELFVHWQSKGTKILQTPTTVTFGYTFLALDPDGNRLRVVSLGTS